MSAFLKGVVLTNSIKYNCVFGGGGIRGLCYIGAIKALDEQNIQLNSIAGSSVGAVFAMLYAIGYNATEIKEFFMNFYLNMFRDINIKIFDGDISFSKGEIFLEWLREKIEKKYYCNNYIKGKNHPVRFKDLEKDLLILTLDINTNTPYIFSKENTPDEEVAMAVRISAGMPGLMKPIRQNGNILVDGDLIKTRPAFKIYDSLNNKNTRLLEFRLEGTRTESSLKNPSDYINSVISTIWYLSTENIYNLYHQNDRYDFIITDTKEVIMFDFTIDKAVREELIEKGYNTTKYYLTKTLVEKKKIINKIYKNILLKIKNAQKQINTNNADTFINIINDILSTMYEDTKYIDISIYEEIENLKHLILPNIKPRLLFANKIKNMQEIKKQTDYIIMLLSERIEDIEQYITNLS